MTAPMTKVAIVFSPNNNATSFPNSLQPCLAFNDFTRLQKRQSRDKYEKVFENSIKAEKCEHKTKIRRL